MSLWHHVVRPIGTADVRWPTNGHHLETLDPKASFGTTHQSTFDRHIPKSLSSLLEHGTTPFSLSHVMLVTSLLQLYYIEFNRGLASNSISRLCWFERRGKADVSIFKKRRHLSLNVFMVYHYVKLPDYNDQKKETSPEPIQTQLNQRYSNNSQRKCINL